MKINEKTLEEKRQNKAKIASHILHRKQVSKPELAIELGPSMPTVLQNVKELQKAGIVEEVGEYESTGGRKAKALSVVKNVRYAAGVDVTANHISVVVTDLKGDMVHSRWFRRQFENAAKYYEDLAAELEQFLDESRMSKKKILGVGISLPGIVDRENSRLVRSHILQVSDINLEVISRLIPYPIHFGNGASSATIAELQGADRNAVYLSLSNMVGGSIHLGNDIYGEDHFRGAEFGHMIIYPERRLCYCGKRGCADPYCSAGVLSSFAGGDGGLAEFFRLVEKKERDAMAVWDTYLKDLSIVIANLRMCFDYDTVLGDYMGGYLKPYISQLGRRVMVNNKFGNNTLYLRNCRYEKGAFAIGITMTFMDEYFRTVV